MANAQFIQTTQHITGTILVVAAGMLVVGAISFLIARKFGGQSRPKKQAIFIIVSGIGFLGIMYLVYLRTSGRV